MMKSITLTIMEISNLGDIERQKWIENRIGCKFYRINENTNYGQFKHILLGDM